MPDLPLDEAALDSALREFWASQQIGEDDRVGIQSAISTYLREAAVEVEKRGPYVDPVTGGPMGIEQRLVGPWLPVNHAEER